MNKGRFVVSWGITALLAAAFFARPLHAQITYEPHTFITYAGIREKGAGTSDGGGRDARFNAPSGLAVDNAGNVFVADSNNHIIRKVSPAGIVTTVAGLASHPGDTDGTGANARFTGPQGVAIDGAGNLYVADSYSHTIRRITADGAVTTLAGQPGTTGIVDGTGASARFNYPVNLKLDRDGTVYVADTYNHAIRKITADGVVTTLAGLPGTSGSVDSLGTAARFNYPQDLIIDNAGIVYVADGGNHAIRKITPAGAVTTLAGLAGTAGSTDGTGTAARFNVPGGIALGSGGKLYVTDFFNHAIRIITPDGVVTTLAGTPGTAGSDDGTGRAAKFNYPLGVVLTGDDLLVADAYNHTVRKVSAAGVVTSFVGSTPEIGSNDGNRTAARFHNPQDVAVDRDGTLYVVDAVNAVVRKIANDEVVTLAGLAGATGSQDGKGSVARFAEPLGVAVNNGVVYVADAANHTIRQITADGTVTTLAGLAGTSGSADGTGAAARFNRPFRIALDGAGVLYVSDTGNHVIRKVTPAGVVSTLAGKAGTSGSADGTGLSATFFAPEGIAVDANGNVFVADDGNQTIRKIYPDGVVTTFAGTAGKAGIVDGTGAAARFTYPVGLSFDSENNLYVTDSGNSVLRRITPRGSVTTLAGSPGLPGNTDGTGSSAQFTAPSGVAVDNSGNIYVTDPLSQVIRKGFLPVPDMPIVDPASASAGVTRHLGVAGSNTISWSWTLIRCPATSATQSWSASVRDPAFTPDVDDLYVVRWLGRDANGRAAIRTLHLTAAYSSLLQLNLTRTTFPRRVNIDIAGPPESTGRIEFSSDLQSWSSLGDFSITNAPVRLQDTAPGPNWRFYRAIPQ